VSLPDPGATVGRMTRSRHLATAIWVAVALIAAGCSGGEQAKPTASSNRLARDPGARDLLERGAALITDPSFAAVVTSLEHAPGGLDPGAVALLAKVRDHATTLASGLRQMAGGKEPDAAARTAARAIADDPVLRAVVVPAGAAAVSDRLAQVVSSLDQTYGADSPDLDPDRYRLVSHAVIDQSTPAFRALRAQLDTVVRDGRSSADLAKADAVTRTLFVHADGGSGAPAGTASSTTSTRGRSRSVLLPKDPAGCDKLNQEVYWDLLKLGAAGAAGIIGALTAEFGVGIAVYAASLAAFAGALHDLSRDSAAAHDPNGPCGPADDRNDPHVHTFDHLAYDQQAVGEFVLTSAGTDTIDVRQQPFATSRFVSVVTAVAAGIAGDRVSFVSTAGGATVRVNGADAVLGADPIALPKGGRIVPVAKDDIRVVWPSGTIMRVLLQLNRMSVSVRLAPSLAGSATGLLGNGDGNPDNDLVTRAGAPIPSKPDRAQLYDQFVNSWRLTPGESLFDYDPGQGTGTFADLTFPDRLTTTADLTAEQRAAAERACADAGITGASDLEECRFDVGSTGDASFATGLARSLGIVPHSTAAHDLADGRTSGTISAPGQADNYSFAVTAGQVRYFAADPACRGSKLAWEVLDPTGRAVSSTPPLCIDVGRVTFATAGTYQLVVKSDHGSTGDYAFSWNGVSDHSNQLAPGRTSGRIETKGQTDSYEFTAGAGEARTFTSDAGCSDSKVAWDIVDSTGTAISSTPPLCIDIGRVTFATAGTYRLMVKSEAGSTGPYAFSWSSG